MPNGFIHLEVLNTNNGISNSSSYLILEEEELNDLLADEVLSSDLILLFPWGSR